AVPEAGGTRFAFLGGLRLPGMRPLDPLLRPAARPAPHHAAGTPAQHPLTRRHRPTHAFPEARPGSGAVVGPSALGSGAEPVGFRLRAAARGLVFLPVMAGSARWCT